MAKKKRANNEGSIIQLKSGQWQARITRVDVITGECKRLAFYGKTKLEAHAKMAKAQHEINTGSFISPQKGTFGTWAMTWLTEYKKVRLRETTFCTYMTIYRTHIENQLGDIPLQKLESIHIQRVVNNLHESGKGGSLIKQVILIVSGALKQGVREGKVFRNVADTVELPHAPKKDVRPLAKEEVQALLAAARTSRHYPALVLELATGLRRGELLALRWSDIDLSTGTLNVNRTVSRVALPNGDNKTQLMFQEPKTKKSKRRIKLRGTVVTVLKEHQMATGARAKGDNLIFPGKGGGPLDPRSFTKRYETILTKAGLPHASFHALRHTVAVLLVQAGEKVKNVQDLLGHEKYSTTMDIYASFLPEEEKDKTAAAMDAILTNLM